MHMRGPAVQLALVADFLPHVSLMLSGLQCKAQAQARGTNIHPCQHHPADLYLLLPTAPACPCCRPACLQARAALSSLLTSSACSGKPWCSRLIARRSHHSPRRPTHALPPNSSRSNCRAGQGQ